MRTRLGMTAVCAALLIGAACRSSWNRPFLSEALVTEANILADRNADWKTTLVRGKGTVAFENWHFINEELGFASACSDQTTIIYRTVDGAQSWQRAGAISGCSVSYLYFLNNSEGFVIELRQSSSPIGYESNLSKTTDGGLHWETVYSESNATLSALEFNGNFGALVGRTDVATPNSIPKTDARMIFAVSPDRGRTWFDHSDNLNQVALDPTDRVGDFLRDIEFLTDHRINVLSAGRKIYSTSDGGDSWTLTSRLLGEPVQTGITELKSVAKGGKIWVAGGTLSNEGKWGLVAVMNDDCEWTSYRLNDYFFSDVEFLNDTELIAVGSIVNPDNFGSNNELDQGVVLFSSTSGKDWTVVYKSSLTPTFTKVAKLSDSRLLVAGNDGSTVVLERDKPN